MIGSRAQGRFILNVSEPPTESHFSPPDWVEHLQTAVMLLDAEERVRFLNPAAEDLLGAAGEQAAAAFGIELRASGLGALVQRAATEQRALSAQDIEWQDAGRVQWLDVQVTTLSGGVTLLELHDAGLRRRAQEDRLRHDRQALSRRVVRQLAHEIRNPLAGLRGAAQLLGRDEPDPDRRELTDIICHEADRLHALVDELLAPAGPARMAQANIHEPVDRLHALLKSEVNEGMAVYRDYDPSLPEIELDGNQLFQALLNLGRNALQSGADRVVLRTRAARRVTWGGALHRLAVAIEIADNGRGVPDDLAESLFFPLVTSRPEGSGLGLAIAQEIVDRHGGRIEFESEPGSTVFRLLLPVPA
ncbi:MAG TPA: nitrogen regulation protein NR(II) [Wenzhouxiangellaceae bacterium]|nr:nitrogen regulation protein NR(II) [Wenzhouxiangellaceae bacterium]